MHPHPMVVYIWECATDWEYATPSDRATRVEHRSASHHHSRKRAHHSALVAVDSVPTHRNWLDCSCDWMVAHLTPTRCVSSDRPSLNTHWMSDGKQHRFRWLYVVMVTTDNGPLFGLQIEWRVKNVAFPIELSAQPTVSHWCNLQKWMENWTIFAS